MAARLSFVARGPFDEFIYSLGNTFLTVSAAFVVDGREFGRFSIAVAMVLAAAGIARGALGESEALRGSFLPGSFMAWSALIGGVASAATLLLMVPWGLQLWTLLLASSAVPLCMQAAWRSARQASAGTWAVLFVDLVWLAVQALVLLAGYLWFGAISLGLLVGSWCIGLVGASAIILWDAVTAIARAGQHSQRRPRQTGQWAYGMEAALAYAAVSVVTIAAGLGAGYTEAARLRLALSLLGPFAIAAAGIRLLLLPKIQADANVSRRSEVRQSVTAVIAVLPIAALVVAGAHRMTIFATIGGYPLLLGLLAIGVSRALALAVAVPATLLRATATPLRLLALRVLAVSANVVGAVVGAALGGWIGGAAGLLLSAMVLHQMYWRSARSRKRLLRMVV